jgi:hypothetical protein
MSDVFREAQPPNIILSGNSWKIALFSALTGREYFFVAGMIYHRLLIAPMRKYAKI